MNGIEAFKEAINKASFNPELCVNVSDALRIGEAHLNAMIQDLKAAHDQIDDLTKIIKEKDKEIDSLTRELQIVNR